MTKPRVQLKKVPDTPISKQLLGMGLMGTAGLLIFLLVAFLAPKSSDLIDASREFDTRIARPQTITSFLPAGVSSSTLTDSPKSPDQPINLDLTRGFILSDQDQRLSKSFRIPNNLKKETAFWFDIYTKYNRDIWLIVSEGRSPTVIEEWPLEKIMMSVGEGPSTSKVLQFLNDRALKLAQSTTQPLRVQQGLADEFQFRVKKQKQWFPAIEKIFRAQKLPWELSRLFIIPNNISLGETADPWTTFRDSWTSRYLLKTKIIDETKSPIKVARAIATLLRKQHKQIIPWNEYFASTLPLDAAFSAALHAEAYWDELELEKGSPEPAKKLKAFKLARATSVAQLTKQLKTNQSTFFSNNPDVLRKEASVILPKSYVFFVAQ